MSMRRTSISYVEFVGRLHQTMVTRYKSIEWPEDCGQVDLAEQIAYLSLCNGDLISLIISEEANRKAMVDLFFSHSITYILEKCGPSADPSAFLDQRWEYYAEAFHMYRSSEEEKDVGLANRALEAIGTLLLHDKKSGMLKAVCIGATAMDVYMDAMKVGKELLGRYTITFD